MVKVGATHGRGAHRTVPCYGRPDPGQASTGPPDASSSAPVLSSFVFFGQDGLALATVFEYPGLDLKRLSLAVSVPAVPAAAERLDVL